MIRSFSFVLVSASVLALSSVACSSSDPTSTDTTMTGSEDSGATHGGNQVDSGAVPVATNAFTLDYVGSCTPSACSGAPSGKNGVASCTSSSDGTCSWNPGAPGATSSSDGGDDTTVSYQPCDQSECPAAPEIDCASGYDKSSPQCGKLNGGACQVTIVCTAHDSGKACADTNGCGDAISDLGVVCDGGGAGSFSCNQTVAGCMYEPECP